MDTRCQDMQPLLMRLAGGELPSADGPRVADHLAECDRCRKEWEALRSWLGALSTMPRVAPPQEARRRVRERMFADRDALATRRAWRGLGVAAAALLAAIGAWLNSRTAPPPGDPPGVRWTSPDLRSTEEVAWTNEIDSGLADVWFSLRDLREGKRSVRPVTPPEGLATAAESARDVEDGTRALRWEWDQAQDDGGFDLRMRDLEKSIENLSGDDQG